MLLCRAAGMLQARATTDSIFKDLGVAADSVDRLKVRMMLSMMFLAIGCSLLQACQSRTCAATSTPALRQPYKSAASSALWLLDVV